MLVGLVTRAGAFLPSVGPSGGTPAAAVAGRVPAAAGAGARHRCLAPRGRRAVCLRAKRKGSRGGAGKAGGGFGKSAGPSKPDPRASRVPASSAAPCGCFSGKSYAECCKPFHDGASYPPTPGTLMRARFAAFHFRVVEFIVDTTHPTNELYGPRKEMIKRLSQNCYDDFDFLGLDLADDGAGAGASAEGQEVQEVQEAKLDYTVRLKTKSDGLLTGFKETAVFRTGEGGRWQYADGQLTVFTGDGSGGGGDGDVGDGDGDGGKPVPPEGGAAPSRANGD